MSARPVDAAGSAAGHRIPDALGRSIVVRPGQAPSPAWASCPRLVVDGGTLRSPGIAVAELHAAWSQRRPVVIELAVEPDELRRPEVCELPPHALAPGFEFGLERLHFLVWANAYDARGGDLVWWHGRKATRRLATGGVRLGGEADVTLADGTPAYVDGGPPHPPALDGAAVVHRWNAEAGSSATAGHDPPAGVLAPDQLAAVEHRTGPARVIAPAGSGKTRVLAERLRHLLAGRHVDASTVTVLAYNTKAAEQLRERCAGLFSGRGPHIRTLNSLGLAICNEFGRAGQHRVISEPEVRDLLGSLLEIRRRANTDTAAPYLEALSTIRLGLVDPAAAEELHPDASGIAGAFDAYRRALAEGALLDFDEQIYRAIEILLTDPAARAGVQSRCRHLLVDEFQDLHPAHLLLIRLLCSPGLDCFGVGDDDQVLYGYSGATPEYLVGYDRYFPGATAHACEVNYRCPPAVVEAAGHLLSYNRHRVDKRLRAAPGREEVPGALATALAPGATLARHAAEAIIRWEAEGVGRDDMVVLARVNSALLPVQVALHEAGVASLSSLTARVLGRTGIRTAFAYLRIGCDPGRMTRRDVLDTVRRPSRGIAPNVVEMLTARTVTSVADIRRLARSLTGRDRPKVAAYADAIDLVAKACADGDAAAALRAVRVRVGLGETMDVLDGSRQEPDRSTHHDDLLALESVAAFHPDPATLEPWLVDVLGRTDAEGPDAGGPAVLLSTVHRIKGREWDRVVVFGVSEGLFPHRLSGDIEGERRVLHVAITRAREQVLLIGDATAPSPFLGELDGSRPRTAQRPGERRPGAGGPSPGVVGGPDAAAAVASDRLRIWRSETARRDAVPAYVVLSDRHLEEIAGAMPASLAALAACRGIGPVKLERWGDEILGVLAGDGAPGELAAGEGAPGEMAAGEGGSP